MKPFRTILNLHTPLTILLITLCALTLLMSSSNVWAQAELAGVRVGQKPDMTRVVFDIKQNHRFTVTKRNNPSRIEVDFYKTTNQLSFKNKHFTDSRLYRMRVEDGKNKLRIILDLHKNYDYNYFTLAKNSDGAERLVVDLTHLAHVNRAPKAVKVVKKSQKQVKNRGRSVAVPPKQLVTKNIHANSVTQSILNTDSAVLVDRGLFVVAIDPGHGGKDPGAVGHGNIYEKNVTLQISKELKRLIDQQPGMRAVLTRDRDVFIPLHERVAIAKKSNADIFISVHADAFHDRSVQGGSIYVLSNGGASSVMARLLAKSENASLQNVQLAGMDNDVAFALSDMSRDANIRASKKLGKSVLQEMQKSVKMHKHTVQSANFAVLKSIDMPSLLVETAFISNPSEASKLINKRFQTRMASSIVRGLQRFVGNNGQKPRWGETLYVRYKVKSGDTLSQIADNYQVSTHALKKLNGIKNPNALYVGKELRIPLVEQVVAGL